MINITSCKDLYDRRIELKYTIQSLSSTLGISCLAIKSVESGDIPLDSDIAKRLIEFYKNETTDSIRWKRCKLGLSQPQLAIILGVSESSIRKAERDSKCEFKQKIYDYVSDLYDKLNKGLISLPIPVKRDLSCNIFNRENINNFIMSNMNSKSKTSKLPKVSDIFEVIENEPVKNPFKLEPDKKENDSNDTKDIGIKPTFDKNYNVVYNFVKGQSYEIINKSKLIQNSMTACSNKTFTYLGKTGLNHVFKNQIGYNECFTDMQLSDYFILSKCS